MSQMLDKDRIEKVATAVAQAIDVVHKDHPELTIMEIVTGLEKVTNPLIDMLADQANKQGKKK